MIQLSALRWSWSSDPDFPGLNRAEAVPPPLQKSGYKP